MLRDSETENYKDRERERESERGKEMVKDERERIKSRENRNVR